MKRLNIILTASIIIVLSLCALVFFRDNTPEAEIKTITPPSQEAAIVPDWAKPAEPPVIDFGENLALSATLTTDGFTQVYKADMANDGSEQTYWEGREFPSSLTAELSKPSVIKHVVLRLNPNPIWGERTQNIEIFASLDGKEYNTIVEASDYEFDPQTANIVLIELDDMPECKYIKLVYNSNSEATGGQTAELELYSE